MVKLVLDDAQEFKKAVDAVSVLIDEAEFIVDEKRFALKATDPSQISMVDFELDKKAFKSYEVKKPTKIGLDLSYLSQVMGRSKAKESLTIELDEKDSRLNITFEGNAKRKFSIPLLDISSAELPNPKINFDAEIKMNAGLLQDALKDASLISNHLTLGVTSDSFFVNASSSKGELNNVSQKNDSDLKKLEVKNECSAMYPLDFLSDMLKAASSSDEIDLFLKTDAPIKISYKIGRAQIIYFLAPRIETS